MLDPSRRFLSLLVGMLALLPLLSLATKGFAQSLPLVVDRTQTEASFWWSGDDFFASPGILERAYDATTTRSLIASSQLASLRISRVYQRADLSPDAAKNLASVAGASSFVLGEARAETQEIAWVGRSSATVTILGTLYDTASGRPLGSVEVQGSGAANDSEAARLEAARSAWRALDTMLLSERSGSTDALARIRVRSSNGASPYVSYRNALERELRAHNVQLQECVAREAEVTLCVRGAVSEEGDNALHAAIDSLHRRDLREQGIELQARRSGLNDVEVRVRAYQAPSEDPSQRDAAF